MGREKTVVRGLDMMLLSGWAVTSTPLVIPITISSSLSHQAKVLMKTIVAASRYVFKLQRETSHIMCAHVSVNMCVCVCVLALITTVMPGLADRT